ncbi:MAG: hypothetical protein CMH54_05760 [Myxococcales bacterium]|nr:hypothetical protein [Myxococcales bacterium]
MLGLVVGLLLVGCPGSKDQTSGSDTVSGDAQGSTKVGVSGECSRPSDCEEGLECNVEKTKGVGVVCDVDADCADYSTDGLTLSCVGFAGAPSICSLECLGSIECPSGNECRNIADKKVCAPVFTSPFYCTTACTADGDCPAGSVCDTDNEECVGRGFCSTCDSEADCGYGYACAAEATGDKFCTKACNPSAPSCGPGFKCDQPNPTNPDFFCLPVSGSCKGDGNHCSPCSEEADCNEGFVCYVSPETGEQYCASICAEDADCSDDHVCQERLKGKICLAEVEGSAVATCQAYVYQFCEACEYPWQCGSEICHRAQIGGVTPHCSISCTGQLDQTSCPSGTFCVMSSGTGSPTGWACTPPNQYKCSGWLNCAGVNCDPGEVCQNGWCVED